ncbi:cobalamin B12-binding domain-containing protein [Zhenpiania hominis]|uniref:Cobalamin B12-binding domain-containing protein n=1 Tax=Zhenpiania hominis TaxID=2763644 RepID=A0A923SQB0_9FIRM|nr:cobalamin-dependent protein [Zhenpiania hominis]MBC6679421.1 cobalamin B12-binding domain-containing protein [Zhenpiania hominis]
MKKDLIQAVYELDEDLVLELVQEKIAIGENSLSIVNQIQQGISLISDAYDSGEYFIADLIMAGIIFESVIGILDFSDPCDVSLPEKLQVKVIAATVKGDIHDIGKNLSKTYFLSRGVEIEDLGVDIPPQEIVKQVAQYNKVLLFLSGLVSESYDSMKETINLLETSGLRDRVHVVICGAVDKDVCRFTRADNWVNDLVSGYDIFKKILTGN